MRWLVLLLAGLAAGCGTEVPGGDGLPLQDVRLRSNDRLRQACVGVGTIWSDQDIESVLLNFDRFRMQGVTRTEIMGWNTEECLGWGNQASACSTCFTLVVNQVYGG